MSAIDDKRNQLGWLGDAVDQGRRLGDTGAAHGRGRARDYQNGSFSSTGPRRPEPLRIHRRSASSGRSSVGPAASSDIP